jgi:hypothetical protein
MPGSLFNSSIRSVTACGLFIATYRLQGTGPCPSR